jgi:multiple sugar transport system permease protein
MISGARPLSLFQKVVVYTILGCLLLLVTFPLYWVAMTSFKTPRAIYDTEQALIPHSLTLENYRLLFKETQIFDWIQFTAALAVTSTLVAVIVAICAAYSITGFEFPGRKTLGFVVWLAYVIPVALLLIPLFLLMNSLHLVDKFPGLVIAYQAGMVPSATWLMMAYFRRLPKELQDAALIDGCTPMGVLVRIILPLAAPGVATAAILGFTGAWSEFVLTATLTRSPELKNVSIGILSFMVSDTVLWGQLMAAAVVALLPVFFLYVFLQRYVVQGLTMGSVKG